MTLSVANEVEVEVALRQVATTNSHIRDRTTVLAQDQARIQEISGTVSTCLRAGEISTHRVIGVIADILKQSNMTRGRGTNGAVQAFTVRIVTALKSTHRQVLNLKIDMVIFCLKLKIPTKPIHVKMSATC